MFLIYSKTYYSITLNCFGPLQLTACCKVQNSYHMKFYHAVRMFLLYKYFHIAQSRLLASAETYHPDITYDTPNMQL